MQLSLLQFTTLALVALSSGDVLAAPKPKKLPPVNSPRLRKDINRRGLMKRAQDLQNIAYATPERNRVFGSPGHQGTVNYIADSFKDLKDYYNVTLQPFTATFAQQDASVSIDGQDQDATTFTYSPNGEFNDVPVVKVNNLGCDQADFPAEVEGKIALIQRGSCEFGLKVARAGTAKAAAVFIYNNAEGTIAGTLGAPGPRAEGPLVPVGGLTLAQGTAVSERLASGQTVVADVSFTGVIEDRLTHNVIIQTKQGDPNNVIMLGSHSDSVFAGPGINDNGSGSAALLEVATALSKYRVKNAVRFGWWSAEEFGLLGAEHYVNELSQEERDKIRLYLNFDMIASPNYALGVYDGDGSKFNTTGPTGSAEAEALFREYFTKTARVPLIESEFNGRSDYGPFLEAGIAAGGLDTGAEGLKTEEEAKLFGGQAGIAYDPNYHQAGDTIDNVNVDAFEINAKAIAHATAEYAQSFKSLPPKKRSLVDLRPRRAPATHSNHRCGGELSIS